LREALQKRLGLLDGEGLNSLRGLKAIVDLVQVWQRGAAVLTEDEIVSSYAAWTDFLEASSTVTMAGIPKRHQVCHLLQSQEKFGNPGNYASWLDEGLNKTLRAACRNQSQATFEVGVLLRMRRILKPRD